MTHNDAQNWINKYEEAWRTNSVSMLDDIFSSDISYKETPWEQAIKGISDLKNFWDEACSRQGNFKLISKIIAIQDMTAVIRLDVEYEIDEPSMWRDVWILTFNSDGLCSSYEGWPFAKPSKV